MPHATPLLSLLTAVACAAASPATTAGRTPEVRPEQIDVVRPVPDTVDALLARLTVRQKVGQLVMPWLLGDDVADSDPSMVKAYQWVEDLGVGGIIISTGTPGAVASKLNRLQGRAPLPLLIGADFEGGITMRVRAGTPFPTQMGVAAGGNIADAYEMGRITALEGRALGVHLAFAPVADVNSNPANPIINTRSFGGDPRDVARWVSATIEGIRAGGMLSTAKHFPGHGDTETDSHLSLPTITAPWSRFDTLELVPFRAAIAAHVDAVMSAHIALPALDNGAARPGTLSPAILTGILRDSLGFDGLITTDALDMGAIAREIGPEEAVLRAFEAGSDLLLMPADPAKAIDAMTRAVESGRISMARLDASVRRLLEMKEKMGLFRNRFVDLDSARAAIRTPAALAAAKAATQRSLVLLKDSVGTVARLRGAPQRVTVVTVADGATGFGREMIAALAQGGWTVKEVRLPTEPTAQQLDVAETAMRAAPTTILATAVRWGQSQGRIGLTPATERALQRLARAAPTVLISFGSPYVISQVPEATSYLIAWSATDFAEEAVARALLGRAPITGTAPIAIPPRYRIRTGIQLGPVP
ncbi:MAG TPA: glycoside hydrolase family 3 N-terminal domain-containing protein [Gemmatimonadales bacterium]|nr:glycoside hydrolase family 3 N-terminal domain-containing protein [Gemmatimonadales bacterium]